MNSQDNQDAHAEKTHSVSRARTSRTSTPPLRSRAARSPPSVLGLAASAMRRRFAATTTASVRRLVIVMDSVVVLTAGSRRRVGQRRVHPHQRGALGHPCVARYAIAFIPSASFAETFSSHHGRFGLSALLSTVRRSYPRTYPHALTAAPDRRTHLSPSALAPLSYYLAILLSFATSLTLAAA